MVSWRYVPFQFYDPYFKTGLNRAVLESIKEGNDPVIWLSGWSQDCINIGNEQKVSEVVDEKTATKRDVTIVRRQGGGGAVFLNSDGEITWGVAGKVGHLKDAGMLDESFEEADDVGEAYKPVCQSVVTAMERLGIEAHHRPDSNDVETENGKITGATGVADGEAIYLGGTLIYETDPEEMFDVLTPDDEKLDRKQLVRHEDRVSSVSAESDATFDETVEAVKQALLDGKSVYETPWSEAEKRRAEELAETYSSDSWIFKFE